MPSSPITPDARYAKIVKALLRNPEVTVGSGKKGFGSSALQVKNKIFAMLSSRGAFVVKLPQQRVDELIASGKGERFDPGHGRLMKEWLVVDPAFEESWLPLAREAMKFVASSKR
jgi:hypothetical protein